MLKKIIGALALGALTTIGGLIAQDAYGPIKSKVAQVCMKLKNKKIESH